MALGVPILKHFRVFKFFLSRGKSDKKFMRESSNILISYFHLLAAYLQNTKKYIKAKKLHSRVRDRRNHDDDDKFPFISRG